MPNKISVSDIKTRLLRPALSSQFEVKIPVPSFMGSNPFGTSGQGNLNLRCSDASLPGSSLATTEVRNSHHGVTEKYAYRRIYDERLDLTFYVDGANYETIRYFETWIDGIVSQDRARGPANAGSPSYHYRARFPKGDTGYKCEQGLEVIKFEKDYRNTLKYVFIDAFPLAISSMPLSYDGSSLVKCQVSFNYLRYIVNQLPDSSADPSGEEKTPPNSKQTPALNKEQNNRSSLTGPPMTLTGEGFGEIINDTPAESPAQRKQRIINKIGQDEYDRRVAALIRQTG